MVNKVTYPGGDTKPRVNDLPPGTIFRYDAGSDAAYMKSQTGIVHLQSGDYYKEPSNGYVVLLPKVTIESGE